MKAEMPIGSDTARPPVEEAVEAPAPQHANGSERGVEPTSDDDDFDEECYLIAFPDIAEAVTKGVWASGRAHYFTHGVREGRLIAPAYLSVLPPDDSVEFPPCHIDASFVSPTGWCLIIGWIGDGTKSLRAVAWSKNKEIVAATDCIARCRREDAEAAAQASDGKLLGFWTVFRSEEP